ncbi:MAG: penicillin-binding transpeptidase domain-containing protein, partial [Acidobacteriaceae bacterium]
WTAAGKTGTAQKIDPKTHHYGSKDIASFSGFAPVNNPAITVLAVLDSPVGAHHGGDTAAPIFQHVAQQVLQYMGVPHDAEVDPRKQILTAKAEEGETPSERLGSLDFDDAALAQMNEEGDADRTVAKASAAAVATRYKVSVPPGRDTAADFMAEAPPEAASGPDSDDSGGAPEVDAGAGVVVDSGGPAVPSFAGETVRGALQKAEQQGVPIQIVGSGIAAQQSVTAGTHLRSGHKVTVWFRR